MFIFSQASKAKREVLIEILRESPNLLTDRDENENTILHVAMSNNIRESISTIFEFDCSAIVNAGNKHGDRPIHIAAVRNNSWAIETLLDHGADINQSNEDDETALHMACSGLATESAMTLLKRGIDVNRSNKSGRTVLHLACLRKNLQLLQAIVTTSIYLFFF